MPDGANVPKERTRLRSGHAPRSGHAQRREGAGTFALVWPDDGCGSLDECCIGPRVRVNRIA